MENIFNLSFGEKVPKYLQIVQSVTNAIRNGTVKKGQQLPSINELCVEMLLSRDTVEKAYNILRKKGIVVSVRGKGFYINRTDIAGQYRVLLLFNKISNYKKQVYNSFIQTMGESAIVDLKIHHCSVQLLESFVNDYLDEYDYFIIMPHFYEKTDEAFQVIRKIPPEKLIILDKDIPYFFEKAAAVYQDFKNDIAEALESGHDLLKKYTRLFLVHPKIIPYPPEIVTGFRNFCMQYNFAYKIINEINCNTETNPKEAYIVIEETDLVSLIKQCRSKGLKIGKDIGIISYNETPLKEILLDGITVISTDHSKMGETAAKLILENRKDRIKNPFMMIRRKSL